jgi:FtsP/CotA-like multicopper oxidase with cupredoxin domain
MRFDAEGREHDIEAYGGRPETTAAGEPVRSGGWMVHCHILEHAKRGMMSYFEVRE